MSAYKRIVNERILAVSEAGQEATGRESDDVDRAAGPLSDNARGRDAEAQMPEARRPAQPRTEMTRRCGRAPRAAERVPGMAGFAAKALRPRSQTRCGGSRPRSVRP